jgi:hypothetical protein
MVSEDQYRLITAAIDDEIDAADADVLAQLLATSAPARELHEQLLHDRALLRNLPRPALPMHFTAQVLSRLPKVHRPVPAYNWNYLFSPPALLLGAQLTTAAAVLIFVLFSFGFLYGLKHLQNQTAAQLPRFDVETIVPLEMPRPYDSLPEMAAQSATHQPVGPTNAPTAKPDAGLTAPFGRPKLAPADVSYRGAWLFTKVELAQTTVHKRIERELGAEKFHELELFVSQLTVADELQRLATAQQLTLVSVTSTMGSPSELAFAVRNAASKPLVQLLRQLSDHTDLAFCSLKPVMNLDTRRTLNGVSVKYRDLLLGNPATANLQTDTRGQLDRFLTQGQLAPAAAANQIERAVLIVLRVKE